MSEEKASATFFQAHYPIRVAIEEIEFLEKGPLFTVPALARIVRSSAVQAVIPLVQKLICRVERAFLSLRQRIFGKAQAGARYVRPDLPAASVLAKSGYFPKIWIDMTFTYRSGNRGGIGRVARELAMAAARTGLAAPVVMEEGRLRSYFSAPGLEESLIADETITYVIIDIFWDLSDEYLAMIRDLKTRGAKVVICIYDLMPLDFPSFFGNYFVSLFAATFPSLINASDACLAISDCSAKSVRKFIQTYNIRNLDLYPVASFNLGADFQTPEGGAIRKSLQTLFSQPFVFLSVGTIEPRKGYAVTIDAFEALWREGFDCHFVIVGREGWVSKALRNRILTHAEFNKRLHWIRDATDAELAFAYRRTYCLIQASITEGFGLPVIEASHMGAPVLASDNDVFREIAGDAISYFEVANPVDLSAKIKAALANRPEIAKIAYANWDESLGLLAGRVRDFFPAEAAVALRGHEER